MILLNSSSSYPLVNESGSNLPVPGKYFSVIEDAYTTVVDSLNNQKDFCMVISYRLVSIDGLTEYSLTETYCLLRSNPRVAKLERYFKRHGVSLTMDEALFGIHEKVRVTYEYLGGFAYPVIYKRKFLGKNA